MSRKKKNQRTQQAHKKSKPAHQAHNDAEVKAKKPINWSRWIKNGMIATCFIGVIAAFSMVYSNKIADDQDVSVIGNGSPTVVQIHDPNCQLCTRLKNNVDSVRGDFKDRIQFKTINIKTPKGRRFAASHNVPHVTLLFFNKQGKRVNTLQGVSSEDDIIAALNKLKS